MSTPAITKHFCLVLCVCRGRCSALFVHPQLKKYEQAVIEKRFSELNEEEKDALLDEVNES